MSEETLEQQSAAVEIGEQARQFLDSDLGRVMVGLADQEVLLAQEKLGDVDPTDTTQIIKLQNDIKVGKWFKGWLADLFEDGEAALEAFKHEGRQT